MSDATKIPFEPIPMPPLGPMPPLSEPSKAMFADGAKPSFSRSTLPPSTAATMLPQTRRPVPADEDPVPLTKFLPSGIAPETPEPAVRNEPAATQSWLRRKRLKLIVGFAGVGAAGFGLHEFAPHLKPQEAAPKPVEVAKPSATPVAPQVAEERVLTPLERPSVNFERHEEQPPLLVLSRNDEPAPLRLTAAVAPLPVPVMPSAIQTPAPPVILPPVQPSPPPTIPSVIPESPKTLTLPPVQTEAPVAPTIIVRPIEFPPVAPIVPAISPIVTIPIETTPMPSAFMPTPAPVEQPKPVEAPTPLPVPAAIPTPQPVPTSAPATSVAAVPLVQPEQPKPVAVGEPKTDYDVDLHRVKGVETYQSISEKYYGNTQYAGALKAYNRGAEVTQLREVQVPPVFVIKKMAPVPTPQNEVVTAGVEEAWSGVTAPKVTGPTGEVRFETYRVPRTGMTMRDVAKAVYGSEREWPRVDNRRNIKYRPDEELPVGAELQVPVERSDWR